MLRIRDWKENYEPKSGRAVQGRLRWIRLHVKLTGEGFGRIRAQNERAMECFGAWILMLELAGDRDIGERGTLPAGMSGDGHDHRQIAESIRLTLGMPDTSADAFYHAIEVLLAAGWLEEFGVAGRAGSAAVIPVTVTLPRALAAPRVPGIVADGEFEALWGRWPAKADKARAAQMWLSVVTPDNLAAVKACAERYLSSAQAASVRYCAEMGNWLDQQFRNGWSGEWAAAATEQVAGGSVFDRI